MKNMKKMIILLFIALIPLKTLAGITMSNILEFIFDKNEIGMLEEAKLSLSEDGSAWGLKFKQGKDNKEIWRIGIYFEGNFKLLEKQFLIPSNVRHKKSCLIGPIISPNGKRWGLIYQERLNGEDCKTPKKDSSYVLINSEKFGPFYHAEQLKFSANDNFSFIGQISQDKKKQLYSRIIRNIINKEAQPINTFITSNDGTGLPKIVYAPDGTHWLLGACTAIGVCYVQEKGNNRAKGPFLSISNIAYWGDWDKADNRAWGISYWKDNSEEIFINTKDILPLKKKKVLKFAYSQHQAKAWGLIYKDKRDQKSLYINAEWPDKKAPVYSELDTLSFAPNGDFLAFSYRKTEQENWQIDIYSLKNGQLKKHFTANPCGEVECDFNSIEDLMISDKPEQFWGYVAIDSNQKQYLVMYKHKSHFQTLGPFKDIQGFYITPDGYSYGMHYTKSDKKIGYYIYDHYAKLTKYEGMSWGSDLLFSSDKKKPLWGFVYKGRENHKENKSQYYVMINGTKIKSREDKQSGFNHASIALLKKEGKKVFSLVYLDEVKVQNRTIYRVRVNEIKQPYIPVPLKQAWTTSHTPNVGYNKILQIGDENFCKGSSEPEIERVCLQDITSSTKIAALRLFFKRLGLERSKTDTNVTENR